MLEADRQRVLDGIAQHIDEYGISVVAVGPSPEGEGFPFAYTIGRALRGLPELLIIAPISPQDMHWILTELDKAMPQARPPGDRVNLGSTHDVMLIEATVRARESFTRAANRYYRTHGGIDYSVQQVLLCDEDGRFPPHPECRFPWKDQPVLGTRLQ